MDCIRLLTARISPVQVAEKSFHSTLFHLVCGGTEMHGRYLLDALPLKGAQVNTFRSASGFQIAVGDGLPAMPPDLAYFWSFQSTVFSLWHFQLPEESRMRSPFSSRS